MSFHRLRRTILRHPLAWVLGLALALVGAQTAGVVHALSHGGAHAPAAGSAVAHAPADPHAGADGAGAAAADCVLCLAAAALSGAAPAPVVAPLATLADRPVESVSVGTAWTPRTERPYASRAPPRTRIA